MPTVDESSIIGIDCIFDPGVIVGYRTDRPIPPMPLQLGNHARVRSNTVLYSNTIIGSHFETGHNVVIREENILGDHVSVWNNTVIDYGCVIGNNVRIHSNCYIAQFTTIEDDVFIAPGVSVANDPHPICALCMKGPTLKKGCRIGVNVTLLPHITIGEGAVIGAGSVVTHDVPPLMLAYGNPARVQKKVDDLVCQFGLTKPYIDGKDPMTRLREDPAAEQKLREEIQAKEQPQPMSQILSESNLAARVLVATFAFNEGGKIKTTVERITAATKYDVVVMDDGSTDGSIDAIRTYDVKIISGISNIGIGAMMKRAFQYALDQNYEILVIMAGNNKDDPLEIPRLVDPILQSQADFVQGSRYLKGGGHGRMPIYRQLATRLHPILFSISARKWISESTNGFRAFRTKILRDPRVDWKQDWLDKYELEPYLLFKTISLGYRHTEAPVTKIYPPKSVGYTKMKAFSGWWSILRPIFLLGLGIKK